MEDEASNKADSESDEKHNEEHDVDTSDQGTIEGEAKAEDKSQVEDQTKVESPAKVENETKVEDGGKANNETPEPVAAAAKAQPVVDSGATPKSTGRRQPGDLSTLDLAAGVLLLVILSLLMANSYVAYMGKSYNQRICAESIALAGKAANEGQDTRHVQLAAYGSWEHCAFPGFFIEHPELIGFKDEITPAKDAAPALRVITISASTKVRVPAPFLIIDKSDLDKDDEVFQHITFKKTYQYQLTNPKGIQGKLIRGPGGRVTRAPILGGPKDKKPAAPAAKVDPSTIQNAPDPKPINLPMTPDIPAGKIDAPAGKTDASKAKPATSPKANP